MLRLSASYMMVSYRPRNGRSFARFPAMLKKLACVMSALLTLAPGRAQPRADTLQYQSAFVRVELIATIRLESLGRNSARIHCKFAFANCWFQCFLPCF